MCIKKIKLKNITYFEILIFKYIKYIIIYKNNQKCQIVVMFVIILDFKQFIFIRHLTKKKKN